MKLDTSDELSTSTNIVIKKKDNSVSNQGGSGSILDMLNPLKSININSELHSFYNFRETKDSVEALLQAQQNLVFYVLHQNFMCDDAHKEFFRTMVGRFYNLPEGFWDYYRGIDYATQNSNYPTMIGLVLLENKMIYNSVINLDLAIQRKRFKRIKSEKTVVDIKYLNALCLEEYWGESIDISIARYFIPSNSNCLTAFGYTSYRRDNSEIRFEQPYEYGRFQNTEFWIRQYTEKLSENYWYVKSIDDISISDLTSVELDVLLKSYGIYASNGIEKLPKIIERFKQVAQEKGIEFNEEWIPNFTNEEIKLIHSLSQTFDWTKEYIIENEDKLNLDVLGLNMTVPWDMDLVKYFIKKGFGGRMSENKAVFDKVFKPLLTDKIIGMLFRLEFEKY